MLTFKISIVLLLTLSSTKAFEYDCPEEGQHFYRYPYDCSKFIECNNGKAKLTDCITGLHFDEESNFCNFPEYVECVVDEDNGEGDGGDGDGDGGDGDGGDGDGGDGDGGDGDGGDGDGGEGNGGDGDGGEGNGGEGGGDGDGEGGFVIECPSRNEAYPTYLPHPSDCGKFYECDWGVAYLFDCPKGLYFNTKINVCDYPQHSGCVQN